MDTMFKLLPVAIINKLAVSNIVDCNEVTARYGLVLSMTEALELMATQSDALKSFGRVDFGSRIINKLIVEFSTSPFLSQHNYVDTLIDLIETFYYFKNETLDEIGDDKLISVMKKCFDKNCHGSLELLQQRELEILARNIRYGVRNYLNQGAGDSVESGEEYYDE
jgi:hypothetical protein